jgi:hypothetical protein
MWCLSSFVFVSAVLLCYAPSAGAYECHIAYPTSLLQPVTGVFFSGNVSSDMLTCFGNREYLVASYHEALGCLSNLYSDCYSLWGSRSITFETDGSLEVYRVAKLPGESGLAPQHMNASRWLQLSARVDGEPSSGLIGTELGWAVSLAKEVKQTAAEPAFFCARCNDWQTGGSGGGGSGGGGSGSGAQFKAHFRPAFARSRDMQTCHRHVIMLVAVMFVLFAFPPFIKVMMSGACAHIGFHFGLQRFIMIYSLCAVLSVILPFVRGHRSRRFLWQSVRAVLWEGQEDEARGVMRSSFKVVDVVFFSSIFICLGSICIYGLFYCELILRESRNTIIKVGDLFSIHCCCCCCCWLLYYCARSESFCPCYH